MKIEMGKQYTSNGEPIRILCTDRKIPKYPILGLQVNELGEEIIKIFTEFGAYSNNEDIKYNLVEVWQPTVNEWCLFCNDQKPHRTILDQFNEMTDNGKFQSVCGTIWNYCYKFDGTLPEYLKNINGEIKC
jgi:hypothetical protein